MTELYSARIVHRRVPLLMQFGEFAMDWPIELLCQGASLGEIGELLGHHCPQTTKIYSKVDLDALRTLALPWPGGVRPIRGQVAKSQFFQQRFLRARSVWVFCYKSMHARLVGHSPSFDAFDAFLRMRNKR